MTNDISKTVDDLWTAFIDLPARRKDMARYRDNDIEVMDAVRDGLETIVNKHRESRPSQEMAGKQWTSFVGNATKRAERERN